MQIVSNLLFKNKSLFDAKFTKREHQTIIKNTARALKKLTPHPYIPLTYLKQDIRQLNYTIYNNILFDYIVLRDDNLLVPFWDNLPIKQLPHPTLYYHLMKHFSPLYKVYHLRGNFYIYSMDELLALNESLQFIYQTNAYITPYKVKTTVTLPIYGSMTLYKLIF